MKDSYSIPEAKQCLEDVIEAVRAGRRITITSRGRALVHMVPVPNAKDLDLRLKQLVAAGTLTAPRSKARLPLKGVGKRVPGALADFLKERHRD